MTTQEFHKARRMFAVVGGAVLVGPVEDERSHLEWLTDLCGPEAAAAIILKATRGFLHRAELRLYRGPDFDPFVPADDVALALQFLSAVSTVNRIAFGAAPPDDPAVQPWPFLHARDVTSWCADYRRSGGRMPSNF
jgi:hypothetical protein